MKAIVTYSLAKTINIGNYENIKIGCDVALECEAGDIEQRYEEAKAFVRDKIGYEEADLLGKFDR